MKKVNRKKSLVGRWVVVAWVDDKPEEALLVSDVRRDWREITAWFPNRPRHQVGSLDSLSQIVHVGPKAIAGSADTSQWIRDHRRFRLKS